MRRLAEWLPKYGVLVAFALLFGANAIWQPDIFLQPENLRNLINQNAAVGIVAVAMTLVIVTGGIDLSVGSLMALAGALTILALNKLLGSTSEGWAIAGALAVGLGAGALLGALNGFFVSVGRVAPFVATLVGLVAYRSFTQALADGGEIRSMSGGAFAALGRDGLPLPFVSTASGGPLTLPYGALAFIAAALIAGFLLNWTRFGRHAIAAGANERAAAYSAVNVRSTQFWAYTLVGLFAGLAALTLTTRMNSVASGTMGLYLELDAIAAVVIGGTSLRGGYGRVWGTVVGVLLLGVITNMLVVAGVSVYWQGVVKGAIILAAVLIQRGKTRD